MPGPSLEVADIFRDHGAAWRAANAGHISLNQFKVMSAIERCRTAALGGHVARCADCAHAHIAYNSCRNRHCPKCQSGAAKTWLAAREAELLPVRYFHLVFTLPKQIADIAHQNQREIYNLLMRVSADTVIKIAADPKHGVGTFGYDRIQPFDKKNPMVVISCPKHGDFTIGATSHVSPTKPGGCPACWVDGLRAQFIASAEAKHGVGAYHYDKVAYVNSKQNVTINCPTHGDFNMMAGNHIHPTQNGRCPNCALESATKTDDIWLGEFHSAHGDKYNYLAIERDDDAVWVKYVCHIHGERRQRAASHRSGRGCSDCGNGILTKDKWVEQSTKIHDGLYDYSLVEYLGATTKVTIICPVHGPFPQQANLHANGAGCAICRTGRGKTTQEFIAEAREAINDPHISFEKTVYTGGGKGKTVTMTCSIHGDFEQIVNRVLTQGSGCGKCKGRRIREQKLKKPEQFIADANAVHSEGTYDYCEVAYTSSDEKVKIICPTHGAFWQTRSSHTNGNGCAKCTKTGSDYDIVYMWQADDTNIFKFGVTSANTQGNCDRIAKVEKASGFKATIVRKVEATVHAKFLENKLLELGVNPKFPAFDGSSEFRTLSDEEFDLAVNLMDLYSEK